MSSYFSQISRLDFWNFLNLPQNSTLPLICIELKEDSESDGDIVEYHLLKVPFDFCIFKDHSHMHIFYNTICLNSNIQKWDSTCTCFTDSMSKAQAAISRFELYRLSQGSYSFIYSINCENLSMITYLRFRVHIIVLYG